MLTLRGVVYAHPNKDVLFTDLSLTVNAFDKIALIGNNGTGKSTLLKIMAGLLSPAHGTVHGNEKAYYVPQHFGQYDGLSVAEALNINTQLKALYAILAGDVTEANMAMLDDDWGLEERCVAAFEKWQLYGVNMHQPMHTLSGGQKTKVFLAGIEIHQSRMVLMDEPTNHLDAQARELLYNYIRSANCTLVVVSHDRVLLNQLSAIYELADRGITIYGGNYDFYKEQKMISNNAFQQELKNKEKELRKAREIELEAIERAQKLDARGRKKQLKAGLPTISMNTLRNNAEKSTAKLKDVHEDKIGGLSQDVARMRKDLPATDKMKLGFDATTLHKGKVLLTLQDINYTYQYIPLWEQTLSFVLTSGQRIAIKGGNGSGKTTLIKLMLNDLQPTSGVITRSDFDAIYIDQDYSLIDNKLTVYQQVQQYNADNLEEHLIKSRLTHFLFTQQSWEKPCAALSGGERMRLMLCCLTISSKAPDLIVLDEPTNNLDIQNIEMLTTAIKEYQGTLIIVSHDEVFLNDVDALEVIELR